MIGGAIACGGTHTMVTPLDVVKCNMQVGVKDVCSGLDLAF